MIAAAASPDGGSALVLELCAANKAKAVVTRLVLMEAERNIREKLGEQTLIRFFGLLSALDPELIPIPSEESLRKAGELVAEKDAHVLAGAQASSADYLITLDRKHLLTDKVCRGAMPLVVCSPGDFLHFLLEKN